MDKTFIMKINETMDLLNKDRSPLGIVSHPVPFPSCKTVTLKRDDSIDAILKHLEDYKDREFIAGVSYYGVTVSINYAEGKFQSMILKGTGEEGERVNDHIALMIVPAEAKSTKNITLHAILTLQEPADVAWRNYSNIDIPAIVRRALREGFEPREDKKVVHRILKVFVDGKWNPLEKVWKVVGNMVTTGFALEYTYEELRENIQKEALYDAVSIVPRNGFIIMDIKPEDEKAFPETHFIFDDSVEDTAT